MFSVPAHARQPCSHRPTFSAGTYADQPSLASGRFASGVSRARRRGRPICGYRRRVHDLQPLPDMYERDVSEGLTGRPMRSATRRCRTTTAPARSSPRRTGSPPVWGAAATASGSSTHASPRRADTCDVERGRHGAILGRGEPPVDRRGARAASLARPRLRDRGPRTHAARMGRSTAGPAVPGSVRAGLGSVALQRLLADDHPLTLSTVVDRGDRARLPTPQTARRGRTRLDGPEKLRLRSCARWRRSGPWVPARPRTRPSRPRRAT